MKRVLFVIALGMVGFVATTGCGSTPATSPNVNVTAPVNDTTNNGTGAGASSNDTGSGASNNTTVGGGSPSTGGDTNQPTIQVGPSQGQGQTTNPSATIKSSNDGLAVVKTIFSTTIAKDRNLHIDYDHTEQDSGHSVYVYHVYDQMPSGQVTIVWIGVRDDGQVKDTISGTDWVNPSQFNVQK